MKNLYAFLFVSLIAVGASAQHVYQPAATAKDKQFKRANTSVVVNGDREVFYTNDFSNCADWDIDNAGNNGFPQFVDDLDFECGTEVPEGFAPIDAIASTTADNGYMMVDSDEYGGEEGGTGIENCWFETVMPIDCSDHPFVSIDFQTQYYMWDGGSSDGNEYCLLEVSRDGTTWPALDTFEESEGMVDFLDGDGPVQARYELFPEMSTQDPVQNPTLITFDITEVAGGQETVYLRFRWKGTWGYAWMVDDIEVYDTPENDLRLENYVTYTDYEGTGMYEYTTWHTSQATEVQMAARLSNIGTADQTNTTLAVDVNGTEVGVSDPVDFAYQVTDTLRVTGYNIPTDAGTYTVDYEIASDMMDENPANNVAQQSFEVSELHYARDNGEFTGFFPAATYGDEYTAATPMQFFGDGTIYAIDVAIVAGDDDAPVICHVLDFAELEIQASTEEVELSEVFYNTGDEVGDEIIWTTFKLEDPWPVAADEGWVAAFESYGGSNVRIGEANFAPDQTAFVRGDFGTAGFDWYFTNEIPMVRFNFDENAETSVNVEEVSAQSFGIFAPMPNPATETTRLRYTLQNASDVVITVRDLNGKLIETVDLGSRPAGAHSYTLNVAEYAAGMYQYTFNVNGELATNKLIIK